eukprot:6190651-Pleurochrysis_carterae.AAC.1
MLPTAAMLHDGAAIAPCQSSYELKHGGTYFGRVQSASSDLRQHNMFSLRPAFKRCATPFQTLSRYVPILIDRSVEGTCAKSIVKTSLPVG